MPRKLKLHMPRTNNRVRKAAATAAAESAVENHTGGDGDASSPAQLNGHQSLTTTSEDSAAMEKPKLKSGVASYHTTSLVSQTVPTVPAAATAESTDDPSSSFTSICINYELGPGHQASVEEHLRDYIAKHPDLANSEAELRPQVEAGVVALKFFRAKYGQEKYGEFVEVMEGFQSKRLDHDGVKRELLAKFGPDEELFQCVNLFLPPSKKFEIRSSSAPASTGGSSNKQTQTTSSPSAVVDGGGGEGGGSPAAGSSTEKPLVATVRAKLTIPMDANEPISGTIPVPMLPVCMSQEDIKIKYDPEKISNILLFLGHVKGYSEELFAATLEVFYKNQNSEVRSKPFLYLRVYEQLMTLYADHPSLKQAYRQFFGPVNVINCADGSVSIQLPLALPPEPSLPCTPISGQPMDVLAQSRAEFSICTKCSKELTDHSDGDSQCPSTSFPSTKNEEKSPTKESKKTTADQQQQPSGDQEKVTKTIKMKLPKCNKKNKK